MEVKLKILKIPVFYFILGLIPTSFTAQSFNNAYSTLPSDNIPMASSSANSGSGSFAETGHVGTDMVMGTPSMFYYQMHPVRPKTKRCAMTESGMKCKFRRDGQVDSYASAASGGYDMPSSSYGVPMEHGNGWGMEEDDEKEGGGELGALGWLGILGLKGLKGAKGLVALAPIILPFLLPILLPIILGFIAFPIIFTLFKILLILFIPIPLVVTPGQRTTQNGFLDSTLITNIPRIAMEVLNSGECVEKVACEIGKTSRKYDALEFVEKFVNKLPKLGESKGKIKKGFLRMQEFNSTKQGDPCSKFVCRPESTILKYGNQNANTTTNN